MGVRSGWQNKSATKRNTGSTEQVLIVVDAPQVIEENGAGEGNRTPDLRFTKPLLYRLSYAGSVKH